MGTISGYCKILAKTRVNQLVNKPVFGKPYLYFGQSYILWSYFFQLGGILGNLYKKHINEFVDAFLGIKGDNNAIMNFLSEINNGIGKTLLLETLSIEKYIEEEYIMRTGFIGDSTQFLFKNIKRKIPPEIVVENSWQHSRDGVAIGIIDLETFISMFNRSNRIISEEKWKHARAMGLDIPEKQDILSYNETEVIENNLFMEYCQQVRPDLYNIIIS